MNPINLSTSNSLEMNLLALSQGCLKTEKQKQTEEELINITAYRNASLCCSICFAWVAIFQDIKKQFDYKDFVEIVGSISIIACMYFQCSKFAKDTLAEEAQIETKNIYRLAKLKFLTLREKKEFVIATDLKKNFFDRTCNTMQLCFEGFLNSDSKDIDQTLQKEIKEYIDLGRKIKCLNQSQFEEQRCKMVFEDLQKEITNFINGKYERVCSAHDSDRQRHHLDFNADPSEQLTKVYYEKDGAQVEVLLKS